MEFHWRTIYWFERVKGPWGLCVCTRTWQFITSIQTQSSVCRLTMLYRKSVLERTMWLKKRYVSTEVSKNGQEEVEVGEVQPTYLRYGNIVPVHLQHEHILPLASSITAWKVWEPLIHLWGRVHKVSSGYGSFPADSRSELGWPFTLLSQLHSMATLASVAWSFLGKDNSLNWIFFNASWDADA